MRERKEAAACALQSALALSVRGGRMWKHHACGCNCLRRRNRLPQLSHQLSRTHKRTDQASRQQNREPLLEERQEMGGWRITGSVAHSLSRSHAVNAGPSIYANHLPASTPSMDSLSIRSFTLCLYISLDGF